jgi:hypothetical protein
LSLTAMCTITTTASTTVTSTAASSCKNQENEFFIKHNF